MMGSTTRDNSGVKLPIFFSTEEGLKKLSNHVRGRKGLLPRHAIELEKRVEYFKGEKLVKFLQINHSYPYMKTDMKKAGIPELNEAEALEVCKLMLQCELFHRSEKAGKGVLEISTPQNNVFVLGGYYTWMVSGPKFFSHLMTGVLIIGFLLITCFPIWPQILKIWMWYLSVTILIVMFSFLSLRATAWFFMWCIGYDYWFLPRLFDESLGFCESFVPVHSLEKGAPGQRYYRTAAVVLLTAFVYWAVTQPTDFDVFLSAQRDFVADLYEGNLLSDVSQESRETMDKPKKSLDDILKDLDERGDQENDPGKEEEKDEDEEEAIIEALLAEEFE